MYNENEDDRDNGKLTMWLFFLLLLGCIGAGVVLIAGQHGHQRGLEQLDGGEGEGSARKQRLVQRAGPSIAPDP